MKKLRSFFLLAFLTIAGVMAGQNSWTISVTPSGARGGYFEMASGESQHQVNYSTTWPSEGLVPTYYIHFPKGSFQITSSNASNVLATMVEMNHETTRVNEADARSFTLVCPKESWYRLKLTGGTQGTTIRDFVVTQTSETVSGINSNVFLADWRSIPSLHLNGFQSTDDTMPTGEAFDWAYDEVLIPENADFLGTYVESFGWGGEAKGYMGIQNNGGNGALDGRTIIFSSWDNGDTDSDPNLADFKRSGIINTGTADRVTAERFGGEGTGTHIILNGRLWKAGKWVKFLVNSRPEQILLNDGTKFNNTLLSAWYKAEDVDDDWKYIGTMRSANASTYVDPSNAFLEEYTRGNNSQGNKAHKAYYRRIFTKAMQSGKWHNRNSFWFGHTDGGSGNGARGDTYQGMVNDYQGEAAIYMESGGYGRVSNSSSNALLPLLSAKNIVPTDQKLRELVERDVIPAIQMQDEQRMEIALKNSLVQLDQTEWTVTAFSSQETSGEGTNGRAAQTIDGDPTTYWHSAWQSGSSNYTHSLTLKHTDGTKANIDKISINYGSRGSNYRAKNVTVRISDGGSIWRTVGTFELEDAAIQTIDLGSTVSSVNLKLDFTTPQVVGQRYMAIHEITFLGKSLEGIKALAAKYLSTADQFNGYSTADLANLKAVSENPESTYDDYQQALIALSQNGKVLKYSDITKLVSLSAERAYVIRNKHGLGDIVATSTDATAPTLRNGDRSYYEANSKPNADAYCSSAGITQPTTNWMIVQAKGADEGYYYIYNIGIGKYLSVATSGIENTFSETPTAFQIARTSDYFTIRRRNAQYGSSGTAGAYLSAQPQNGEDTALGRSAVSDNGAQWLIYDNYSLTPEEDMVWDVRIDAGLRSSSERTGDKEYLPVTWIIKDANGNEVYRVGPTMHEYGSTITKLPSEVSVFKNRFISFLGEENLSIVVEQARDVNLVYRWNGPFSLSSGNSIKYYDLKFPNSNKYLSASGSSPYKLTDNRAGNAYRWFFQGDPFRGITIHPATSPSKGLQATNLNLNGTAGPSLTTTPTAFEFYKWNPEDPEDMSFCIRVPEANYFLNNYQLKNKLYYWSSGVGDANSRIEAEELFPADGYYRLASMGNPANWLTVSDDGSRLTTLSGANIAIGSQLAYADPSTIWRITEQSDLTYQLSARGVYAKSQTLRDTAIPTSADKSGAYGCRLRRMADDTWTIQFGPGENDYLVNSEEHKSSTAAAGVVTGSVEENGNNSHWYIFAAQDYYLPLAQTDDGGATYAAAYLPFGYSVPSEVSAYTVTVNNDDETAEAHKLKNDVPAQTGVVICSPEGSENVLLTLTTNPKTILDASLFSANQLTGACVDVAGSDEDFALVFSSGNAAFYPIEAVLSEGKIPSYTAYLPSSIVPEGAAVLPLLRDDVATQIEKVELDVQPTDRVYDLQGRRVVEPKHGVYIINGKKIIR